MLHVISWFLVVCLQHGTTAQQTVLQLWNRPNMSANDDQTLLWKTSSDYLALLGQPESSQANRQARAKRKPN